MQFLRHYIVTVSTDDNYTLVTVMVQNEKYHITKLHGPVFLQLTIEKHGNWPDI